MPQLIAMIIVVVGAMVYMFQTFGGTGDKIEGIAQKTSVITEIMNIKNGLKLAARSGNIGDEVKDDKTNTLYGLATLAYFPEQINDQIRYTRGTTTLRTGTTYNKYFALSFGGEDSTATNSAMLISLVAVTPKMIPGIYVEFQENGSLSANGGFLESQIANDLKDIAYIDRAAEAVPASVTLRGTGTALNKRLPEETNPTATQLSDGKFIIYFNDFGSNEVAVDATATPVVP